MKSANSLADLLAEVIPANLYQTVVEDLASSGPWAPVEIMGKPSTLRDKDPEDLDALLRLQNPRDGDRLDSPPPPGAREGRGPGAPACPRHIGAR